MLERLEKAASEGRIFESTLENAKCWTQAEYLPEWVGQSIGELIDQGAWEELNDRFYRELAFGTGGMRGRTIGRTSSAIEQGDLESQGGCPAYAAVGTNVLNDFNIVRATIGLFHYVQAYLKENGRIESPRFVIAHDVRHFSRHFCELAASTWNRLGGQALIFDGPRSTPQLSFAVRHYGATCGAVITASHNPPHDNGFKVYFEDGAQIVSPHAELIVSEVAQIGLDAVPQFLNVSLDEVVTLNAAADEAYLNVLEEVVLDREVMEKQATKVVFSPIHGTGAVSSLPILRKLGIEVVEVPEQMEFDGRFPTVRSPNPENAEGAGVCYRQGRSDRCGSGCSDRSGRGSYGGSRAK